MDGAVHPPEPWRLRGAGWATAWLVDAAALPALPAPVEPVAVLGKAVVATAFADYRPGGVLVYRELLAAVLVRQGARLGLSSTHAWVDSHTSRAGGRALWGIPKEMARFELTGRPRFAAAARDGSGVIAAARLARPPRWGVPVRAGASMWQDVPGGTVRTPVRVRGSVALARVRWRVEPSGPLGLAAGRASAVRGRPHRLPVAVRSPLGAAGGWVTREEPLVAQAVRHSGPVTAPADRWISRSGPGWSWRGVRA